MDATSYQDARKILSPNPKETTAADITESEELKLAAQIDEAIKRMEEMNMGQQVIFEELQELKQHMNLNKKTWTQLLKGKLLDLLEKEVLSKTAAAGLYEMITKSIKADRFILP